jgi:hypothetical protein
MITPPIPPTMPRLPEDLPILEMAEALRKAREEILETFGDDMPEDVQERLMTSYLRAQGIVTGTCLGRGPGSQNPLHVGL